MNSTEALELVAAALIDLPMDLDTDEGKRTYLAYLAARHGLGADSTIERRIAELREDLGF